LESLGPLPACNLALKEGQVADYENTAQPKNLLKEASKVPELQLPYWQSHGYNAAVGIDSQGALMQQHLEMNKKSLKERALLQKTKKVFRDEENDEHYFRDEEAQRLNQETLFHHHPTIPSLLRPMYEPVRPEILNP